MRNVLKGLLVVISFAFVGCGYAADNHTSVKNHEFKEVQLGYPAGDLCSFQFGPVYFCDERHLIEIKNAIAQGRPNFNHHFIILPILERKEYYQRSLVAIDSQTGIAYPLPVDFYSGDIDAKGNVKSYGRLLYSIDSNRVCVIGAIVAHRQIDSGKLCWDFDGSKFVGHHTPYMD